MTNGCRPTGCPSTLECMADIADLYEFSERYRYPSLNNSAKKFKTSPTGTVKGSLFLCAHQPDHFANNELLVFGLQDDSKRFEASAEIPSDVKDSRIWAMPLIPEPPDSL